MTISYFDCSCCGINKKNSMIVSLINVLRFFFIAVTLTYSLCVQAQSFTITVEPLGSGRGSVAGAGLTCAGTCTGSVPTGSSLSISASPGENATFGGWSLSSCGTSPTCSFTPTSSLTVYAYFIYTPFLAPVTSMSWTPPLGIPPPSFGIEESYRRYDDVSKRNPSLQYVQNAEGGYYTHFVSTEGCSDTNNIYGSPQKPRCRIPIDLPEGSIVQLQGGPFTYGNYNGGTAIGINGLGTVERPIFIRGLSESSPVVLTRTTWIRGHYLILENINWDLKQAVTSAVSIRVATTDPIGHNHHIAIRHSEAMNVSKTAGSGAVFSAYGVPGNEVHDIVYYANHVHPDDIDVLKAAPDTREKDTVGISVTSNSERIWIVDNIVHGAAGDAVGAGHGANYTARNYFVGRNDLYDCGENAVDFKEVENVVVSQNKMHNMRGPSAGSDGTVAVAHYGPTYSPRNLWFLFNEIYDADSGGIQVGGTSTHETYFVGNIIHDITNSTGTGHGFLLRNSQPGHLVGNLFYRNDRHLVTGPAVSGNQIIENNIFADVMNGGAGYHIEHEVAATGSAAQMMSNLFFQSQGTVRIKWGSSTFSQVPSVTCATCLYADPQLVDPANGNFRMRAGSPLINAGIQSSLLARYSALFGVSVLKDFAGLTRPVDGGWEIGPYEFSAVPKAPQNLAVTSTP